MLGSDSLSASFATSRFLGLLFYDLVTEDFISVAFRYLVAASPAASRKAALAASTKEVLLFSEDDANIIIMAQFSIFINIAKNQLLVR